MPRLVGSSVPGQVERFRAMDLLRERVVLTRAVCEELNRHDGRDPDLRARTALDFLLRWIIENQPDEWEVEPNPRDGLDAMVVPPEGEPLMAEIRAGTPLCQGLAWLWTADCQTDIAMDERAIAAALLDWRAFRRSTL